MKSRRHKPHAHRLLVLTLLVATLCYASSYSVSDDFTDRRLTTGARIFRALLAADLDITGKAGENGNLRICLIYTEDRSNAELVAKTLANRDDTRIRNLHITTEIVTQGDCLAQNDKPFAGIFLTESLNDHSLQMLLKQARKNRAVVFSPLEGDVERGVQTGLAVEARVRPYVNPLALEHGHIRLKDFFMRVAKRYEE